MTGHGTRGLLATSPQPYTVLAVYSPVPRVATALPYGHYGGGGLKAGYSGGGAASACWQHQLRLQCSGTDIGCLANLVSLASSIAPQPYLIYFLFCNHSVPFWPAWT